MAEPRTKRTGTGASSLIPFIGQAKMIKGLVDKLPPKYRNLVPYLLVVGVAAYSTGQVRVESVARDKAIAKAAHAQIVALKASEARGRVNSCEAGNDVRKQLRNLVKQSDARVKVQRKHHTLSDAEYKKYKRQRAKFLHAFRDRDCQRLDVVDP